MKPILAIAAFLLAAPALAMPAAVCQPLSEAASSAMELRQMGMPRSAIDAMMTDAFTDPDQLAISAMLLDAVYSADVQDTPAMKALAPKVFGAVFLETCLAK